jgi:hypothetical protein
MIVVVPQVVVVPRDIGGLSKGMKLVIDGKQYVVVKMGHGITCRRTFGQWCKDLLRAFWTV